MKNRFLHQTTQSPSFKDTFHDNIHHSSTSNKVVPSFITQKTLNLHQSQIKQTHNQLNSYIDDLDEKIQKIVQYNQGELLFAYKNHLERVRAQMTDFKEEAMTVLEAEASHKQKINLMEKQLIIFREEALNIFEKSMKKDKIIELLQRQLEEYKSQNQHMKQTVKNLIKRNKELQASNKMVGFQQKKRQKLINEDYLGRIQVNSFTSLGVSSNKKFFNHNKRSSKERVMTTSFNSKMLTQSNFRTTNLNKYQEPQQPNPTNYLDNFTRKLKLKLAYIDPNLLENIIDSASEVYNTVDSRIKNPFKRNPNEIQAIRKTDNSLRSKSYHTCESNSKIRKSLSGHSKSKSISSPNQMASDNELKDFFRKSVQSIKKEIVRRKKINTINFFKEGCPVSLQDFKKIDFINLVQLVFSNEKIIHLIYKNIFNTEH